MTREEIREKILHGLKEQFGSTFANQSITDATQIIEDLAADSLDLVELTMELEDTFDIKITDKESERLTTVGSIIEFIVLRKGN